MLKPHGILSNESLANIDVLSSLTSVPGIIALAGNASLTNLNGFSNLTSVGGMDIQATSLTSLAGLENSKRRPNHR